MYINGDLLKDMFKQAAAELTANKDLVDALNVFPVPDGDTGTNMSLTMAAAVQEVGKVTSTHASDVAKAMSKGSLMGARGNSGVILSQIFRGFAKGCEDKQHLSSIDLAKAMRESSDTAYKAVMKPVEGTILTVIRKTGEKAMDYTEEEVPVADLMKILINRAEETLDKTPDYLPVLKQAGVVDAGGKGLVFILKGFLKALTGETSVVEERVEQMQVKPVQMPGGFEHAAASIDHEDINFTYCTEFILRTAHPEVEVLRDTIYGLGDSMVFVQDDDLVKIHVHTDNPGQALENALKYGELMHIKIENMKSQHSEIMNNQQAHKSEIIETNDSVEEAVEPYGFVSVSMGDGLSRIFSDLGVDHIIEGGQTMNPSTEDILKAIATCRAEHVIVLPNNSNIILAANQAKELAEKPVSVIPTKTVPQGIAAMIEFDPTSDPTDNAESMTAAAKAVKTIQVTYSVRDTQFGGKDILKGDILGISEGDITEVGKDIMEVTLAAIANAVNDDAGILTIYYGEEVKEEAAMALKEKVESLYEDLEIEVYYGGQPIYYYVISVE